MPTKKLGEIVTLKRGYDLPGSQRVAGTIPIVSSSGITDFHNEPKVAGPGVVTGRYGTIGEVFFVSEDYWPLNTALYVEDFKRHNARFVFYFLKNVLKGIQSDKAAVPGLNRNDLHARDVVIPPTSLHAQIASILSAYDDLIENNRRRIMLLEEAARLLYREWFVHLRFPGHEHTPVHDGVPQGWTVQLLDEICEEVRSAVDPSEVDPSIPYIGLEHIPRRSIALGTWGSAEDVTSTKFKYKRGDILFGKIRAYFHKVGVTFTDGITSSDAIVIRPRDVSLTALVLMTVSSDLFVAVASKTANEGSKMPRANWAHLKNSYQVFVPPTKINEQFGEFIGDIVAQLENLTFQNRKLAKARDLLLPRLMSGEIEV